MFESFNFCFIIGCGHSGTTLLTNILAHHPNIYAPPYETNVFMHGVNFDRLNQIVDHAKSKNVSLIVEKTPTHVFKTTQILSTLPQSRFLIIARDGRDVIASIINRGNSFLHAKQYWIESNLEVLKIINSPNIISKLIKYEDFVKKPKHFLNDICNFLNVNFESELLNYHEKPIMWGGMSTLEDGDGKDGLGHKKRRNYQVNQPIVDNSGIFKRYLSSDQLENLYNDCSFITIMEQLDYNL